MTVLLRRRSEIERLGDTFAALLGDARRHPTDPLLVGIEHEFRVRIDGRPVDFRRLVHEIGLGADGARVDPADPNAYRGRWGGAITADGREAEVAIPPVEVEPGFSAVALTTARAGRRRLEVALPGGELEGFSTHLSVSVPAATAERAAVRFAETFAPALMLLLDARQSPGLIVRPRATRLELGGEFADGERLRAAMVFAVGSALATVRATSLRGRLVGLRSRGRTIPPRLRVRLEPAVDRFGWYVDRRAFGPDLYALGRAADLVEVGGRAVSAQAHLDRCWEVARREVEGLVSSEEVALVDDHVTGTRPLGVELPLDVATSLRAATHGEHAAAGPFGEAVVVRERGDITIEPAVVGWDVVVLRAYDTAASVYAVLPRATLGDGLRALDGGALDTTLRRALAASRGPTSAPALNRPSQTARPGLYKALGRPADLLAPERDPAGGGGKRQTREAEQPGPPATPPTSRLRPPQLVALLIAVGAIVAAAAAFGRIGDGSGAAVATPSIPVASGATDPASPAAPSAPVPSAAGATPFVATYQGMWSLESCVSEAEVNCRLAEPRVPMPADVTLDCSRLPVSCTLTLELDSGSFPIVMQPAGPGRLRFSQTTRKDELAPRCIYEQLSEIDVAYGADALSGTWRTTHDPLTCFVDGTPIVWNSNNVHAFDGRRSDGP